MAAETGSQKSSDSGKVYDFKDSKTSGVVTVTKSWDDSMSNDERPVPDISISTSKPGKNPLGYTITYHGNGLTFADGNSENEIIVNSSGKIVSGQYKLPGNTAVTWYLDSQCTSKIETDNNGLPLSGIFSDLDLYAKPKTFLLKGYNSSEDLNEFSYLIPSTATSIVFTAEAMPTSAVLIDVDADGDGGVVAWMDGTTMKVSTQISGQKIIAPSNSECMFSELNKVLSINLSNLDTSNVTTMEAMFYFCRRLTTIDLTPLNTSNVTSMNEMFRGCSGMTSLDLTPLDTNNVTDISGMFHGCSGLTNLDLTPLDNGLVTDMSRMFYNCKRLANLNLTPLSTSNVTNMSSMFSECSGLTSLDLTHLDTQKVTNMSGMFYNCSNLTSLNLASLDTSKVSNMKYMFSYCIALTTLSLGEKFAFVGSDYYLPKGIWYSSNGTAYTSDGTTCTIPNNKADTYTRR